MTEPRQTEERRLTLDDALARLPRIDMAYKIPPSSSPDTDALSVLGTILSAGRSSRFYESIVRQKQLSTGVGAGTDGSRGPGLFNISATALPGKTLKDLEDAIDQEVERVKTAPIADWEIQKARTGARRSFVAGLGSSFNRAVQLSARRHVLQRSRSYQHARRSHRDDHLCRRATRRQPVPREDKPQRRADHTQSGRTGARRRVMPLALRSSRAVRTDRAPRRPRHRRPHRSRRRRRWC